MKKSILGIKGVSELNKKEQSKITGAGPITCARGGTSHCKETGSHCKEFNCQGLWGGDPGGMG
ncbi:hypothetical protein H2O64_03300 [Kordia sp. YSTF-M3]|uniref:Bacteriocin n=1 Tax=Kordia aestuariivivens TaxID=2759037 RepID=A0ABR7Q5P6_9FLAO|nr:hypothetical protein [Kordia aestuariivivens]MBC8753679.1 hypothetical protein [Kordia aestuariivivens]